MGETTKIQWTDRTWSPWRGCSKVSPGCANCYAAGGSVRNPKTLGVWGPNGTRIVNADWGIIEKWDREAEAAGVPVKVFPSYCDPFEEWGGVMSHHRGAALIQWEGGWRPGTEEPDLEHRTCNGNPLLTMHDVRRTLFDMIDRTPNLIWQLLTKRVHKVKEMLPVPRRNFPDLNIPASDTRALERLMRRENVHLYASVENQECAAARLGHLLKCRELFPVLGLSAEPLLGPIKIPEKLLRQLDHVIIGGESGQNSRPCRLDWIRDLVKQCRAAGVAVFVKQLGRVVRTPYYEEDDPHREHAMSGRYKVISPDGYEWNVDTDFQPPPGSVIEWHPRDKKGGDPSEWPFDLQGIRELPEVRNSPTGLAG